MAITLTGPRLVAEGAEASYAVRLESSPLADGGVISFTVQTLGVTATQGYVLGSVFPRTIDFAGILGDLITAGSGLGMVFSTAPSGAVTVTLSNGTGGEVAVGSELVSFAIRTAADASAELPEEFQVVISDSTEPINNSTLTTTIVNVGGIVDASTTSAGWALLNGDVLRYGGIAGTELSPISVETGADANSVTLIDGVAFATLDTGAGDDRVSVLVEPVRDDINTYVQFGHAAYQAQILTGEGNDIVNMQSAANSAYVRRSPQDAPGYDQSDYYQSVVDLGVGDDYVYAFLPYQSEFLGRAGRDTAFFYGRLRDWSFELVDANGGGLDLTSSDDAVDYSLWAAGEALSSTARQNLVRGIEYLQFNDVLLDLNEALLFTGASSVAEGDAATYQVALAGDGLARGQTVAFSVELTGDLARAGLDYAALLAQDFQAATGVTLNVLADQRRGVAAPGVFTIEATANQALAAGARLVSFAVSTVSDQVGESGEALKVAMSGFQDPQQVATAIVDGDVGGGTTPSLPVDPLSLELVGPRRVKEGAVAAGFKVNLEEGALASGDSVTFTLRSRAGTARAGKDFDHLTARRLKPGAGMEFAVREQVADGVIRVTATNVSGSTLNAGSSLAGFSVRTRQDSRVESKETFKLLLSAEDATVSGRQWRTSIIDNDIAPASAPASGSSSPAFTPARLPAGTFGDGFDFGRLRLGAL